MATVTPSVTHRGKLLGGGMRANIVDVGLSGNYTAGGETLGADNCGLGVIFGVVPMSANGFITHYDYTNGKLQFFESGTADATLDELDAAALPAALTNTVKLLVIGR